MKRLMFLTLNRVFDGKLIVKEFVNHLTVNTVLVGNYSFNKWRKMNFISAEYIGGDNYKINTF